jgi:pimeloyl-ACP methyl ester carboxylesterase
MTVFQASPEAILPVNGVELCVQTSGHRDDPAILLIAGGGSSMLDWPEEFCQRLAAGSRFVIRYDHRDTGRSVTYPPGAPGYTAHDLDEDAVGVLDALGIATAHVVGFSGGGGMAQQVAVRHPGRVASLTLMSTSPIASNPDDLPLPGPTAAAMAAFNLAPPDWSDRAATVEYVAAQYRPLTSASRPVSEAYLSDLAGRIVDRAVNVASMSNHWVVIDQGEGDAITWEQLAGITAPTLVMHGTEDPLFPAAHGEALSGLIPNARLLLLEHTGHEMPPAVWDTVAAAILDHTTRPNKEGEA